VDFFVGPVVAIVVTTVALVFTLPTLRRMSMDVPNHRSSHNQPIPRGGGLAVVAGLLAGSGASGALGHRSTILLLIAVSVVTILGLLDDVRSLPVAPRLFAQFVVAVCLTASVVTPDGVTEIVGVVLAAFVLVGYINAFNFMDGINGISSVTAAVAGSWYAAMGLRYQQHSITVVALALTAAALGFVPWNAPRARVFLGDSGSYALGMAISGLALVLWQSGVPWLAVAAPLVIYLADTSWALGRRIWGGRSWREPHREHVYQQLVDGGWSHLRSAAIVGVFSVLACASWVVGHLAWDGVAATLFLVLGVGYLSTPKVFLQSEATTET